LRTDGNVENPDSEPIEREGIAKNADPKKAKFWRTQRELATRGGSDGQRGGRIHFQGTGKGKKNGSEKKGQKEAKREVLLRWGRHKKREEESENQRIKSQAEKAIRRCS